MNEDLSSPRPDSGKPSTYQIQQPSNPPDTSTVSSSRRVGVYDRPDSPTVQNRSTIGVILLLIAVAFVVYFLFLFLSS
jgi:hypothetical protein